MESLATDRGPSPGEVPQPPSSAPKVLGALNIAFGALLLLCGGYALVMALFVGPMMSTVMAGQQEELEQAHQSALDAQVAELRRLQSQAGSAEERAALESQIQTVLNAPAPPKINFSASMMPGSTPGMMAYQATDAISGMVLNILMVVSGIGLLRIRSWGRSLALWVAGLKITRLLALLVVNIILVVPVQVQQMQEMFKQVPGGGGAPPAEFLPWMGVYMLAAAVVTAIVGAIYPVIVLWLLNTKRVRATFEQG